MWEHDVLNMRREEEVLPTVLQRLLLEAATAMQCISSDVLFAACGKRSLGMQRVTTPYSVLVKPTISGLDAGLTFQGKESLRAVDVPEGHAFGFEKVADALTKGCATEDLQDLTTGYHELTTIGQRSSAHSPGLSSASEPQCSPVPCSTSIRSPSAPARAARSECSPP